MARDIVVGLRINGDGSVAINALSSVEAKLRATGSAGGAAGNSVADGLNKAGNAADGAGKKVSAASEAMDKLKGIAAGIATIGAAKAISGYADEYSLLNSRLKLATGSQAEYTAAQQQTFAIAQRTRADVGSTVDLYTKLSASTKALGGSQADALKITEAITQTFKISGASAAESAGAIRQFAQGLGAGALRGDEFNSVVEQSPRLAKALADGLGVNTGQLRKMAEQGALTGEVINKALLGQADKISAEFGQVPLTVGDSLTQLQNAATKAFGQLFGGANSSVAEFISFFADGLAQLPQTLSVVAAETIGFFDRMRIGVVEKVQVLTLAVIDKWLAIKEGASELAGAVELVFAKLAAGVAAKLQPIAEAVSALGGKVGIDTSGIDAFSSKLGVLAQAESTVSVAVAARTQAIRDARAGLEQQALDIIKNADAQRAASREAVAGARAQAAADNALVAASTATTTAVKSNTVSTAENTAARKAATAAAKEKKQQLTELNAQLAAAQKEITAAIKAEQQAKISADQYVASLRGEVALLALSKTEREKQRTVLGAERKARELLGKTSPELVSAYAKEIAALERKRQAQLKANAENEAAAAKAKSQAEAYAQPWVNGLDSVAGAFGDLVSRGFKDFSSFKDSIKNSAKQLASDLVQTFLKQKITIPLQAVLTGQGQSGGGGISGILGSIFGGGSQSGGGGLADIIGSVFGRTRSGAAAQTGASAGGLSGLLGGLASSSSFISLIAGPLASALGGNGTGATIGAAIGSIFGPIGSALGGLVGGAFSSSYRATGAGGQTLNFGANFGGSTQAEQSRQRSFYRGTQTRTVNSALDAQTLQQGQDFSASVVAQLQADAAVTGRSVATIISAEFKRTVDKNGNLIKEGGTIAGRYFAESISEFQTRVSALSRIGQLGDEARTIAERFNSGSAAVISSAAQFLVNATSVLRTGATFAGTTLTEVTSVVERLAAPGESLADTFGRIAQASAVLSAVADETGIKLNRTGAEFGEFAARLATAAGGVQQANDLLGRNISAFFTDEERRLARLAAARAQANSLASAAGFDGIVSNDAFRSVLDRALAGAFDPERTAAILRYGSALASVNELTVVAADNTVAAAAATREALDRYNALATQAANDNRTAPETLQERLDKLRAAERDRIKVLEEAARAAGLSAVSERTLAQVHARTARDMAQAYSALEASTRASIDKLYDIQRNQTNIGSSLGAQPRIDPERFGAASAIAAQLRQLSEASGRQVLDLANSFDLPLQRFVADLGVTLDRLEDPRQFDAFVSAARQLGIELPSFAERFNISIGALNERGSAISQAFTRAIDQAGPQAEILRSIFERLQGTQGAAATAIQSELSVAVRTLPVSLQALFAPLLDDVDTTTTDEATAESLADISLNSQEQVKLLTSIDKALNRPDQAQQSTAITTAVQDQSRATTTRLDDANIELRKILEQQRETNAALVQSQQRIVELLDLMRRNL